MHFSRFQSACVKIGRAAIWCLENDRKQEQGGRCLWQQIQMSWIFWFFLAASLQISVRTSWWKRIWLRQIFLSGEFNDRTDAGGEWGLSRKPLDEENFIVLGLTRRQFAFFRSEKLCGFKIWVWIQLESCGATGCVYAKHLPKEAKEAKEGKDRHGNLCISNGRVRFENGQYSVRKKILGLNIWGRLD